MSISRLRCAKYTRHFFSNHSNVFFLLLSDRFLNLSHSALSGVNFWTCAKKIYLFEIASG